MIIRALGPLALLGTLALGGCAADDPIAHDTAVGVIATGCGLGNSIGGGAIVGDGLVVVTAHTVAGARSIEVDVDGIRHPGEVVAFDKDLDIAILRVDIRSPAATLGTVRDSDDATLVTWHPDRGLTASFVEVRRRIVVTIEDIYVEGEHERRAFEFAAPIRPGDSGAPIYGADSGVAGIVYAASRDRADVGFAVRAVEIGEVLARVGEPVVGADRCR